MNGELINAWLFDSSGENAFMEGLPNIILIIAALIFMGFLLHKGYRAVRYSVVSYNSDSAIPQIKKLDSASFKKNRFKDYCGIEIECLNKKDALRCAEANQLHFEKGGDGSLSSGGVEFKSTPSRGDKLFEIITIFCRELNNRKYFVDTTCGLHIHIETAQDLELLKKMYVFYSKYENLFFEMLPKSRQGNNYCEKFKHIDSYPITKIKKISSLGEFKKVYYETNFYGDRMRNHGHKKRYCWCNFHSIFYRGTLEIRSHSGTINGEKIKKWILIHLYIRDFLKQRDMDTIDKLSNTRETFLEIFPSKLKKYIRERWDKFPSEEENKFQERNNNVPDSDTS